MLAALESLSWRSRYLILGERIAWCAVNYEHRDEWRCMAFIVVVDMLFGPWHCVYSWAWWGCADIEGAQCLTRQSLQKSR